MPFGSEKDAVVAVVKANECNAATFIENNATTYAELLDCLFEFSKSFDCTPTYLDQLLSLISPSALLSLGVYYNQTLGSVTNPRYIANSTITTVTLDDSFSGTLEVVYQSQIINLLVTGVAVGKKIVVTGGAYVQNINVDTVLDLLTIKACKKYRGKVGIVKGTGMVTEMVKDDNAIFGGIECVLGLP